MFTHQIKLVFAAFFVLLFSAVCQANSYDAVGDFVVKGISVTNAVSRKQLESAFKIKLASTAYDTQGCTGEPFAKLKISGNDIWLAIYDTPDIKLPIKQTGRLESLKNFNAKIWIEIRHIDVFSPIKLGDTEIDSNMTFDKFKIVFPISARQEIGGYDDKNIKHYAVLIDKSISKGVKKEDLNEDLGYVMRVELLFKNNKLIMIGLYQGDDC
jgi:hypothetical protein